MKEFKGTPEPWVREHTAADYEIIRGGPIGIEVARCRSFIVSEHEANADLIAAAPDLLKACCELVRYFEAIGMGGENVDAARAAIAKALGES